MGDLILRNSAALVTDSPLDKFLSGKLSEKTKRAYQTDIKMFMDYMGISTISELLQLSPGEIFSLVTSYRDSLMKTETVNGKTKLLNGATVARKVSTLKTFFQFLTDLEKYTKNPIQSLKSVKVPTYSTSEGMEEAEVSEIFKQVKTDSILGKRDKLILALLIHCAMRRSEIAYLKIGDIGRDSSGVLQVNFIGKGGKDRALDLKPDIIDPLVNYLNATGRTLEDKEQFLFLSHSNRTSGEAITDQTIWNVVLKYAGKAGIKKNITPHSFRHTAVTIALQRNNGNYQRVMNLTGHSDTRMVMRYDRGDKSRNNATYDLPSFY